jgi:hypothetical protein
VWNTTPKVHVLICSISGIQEFRWPKTICKILFSKVNL